jgi:hypothetical protein
MLCSPVEVHHRFGEHTTSFFIVKESAKYETCKEQRLICGLAYSSTLMMEAVSASETSMNFCWTTLRYVPEITAVKKLKSNMKFPVFIEPKISLPCLHDAASRPKTDPYQSSPHTHILFPQTQS